MCNRDLHQRARDNDAAHSATHTTPRMANGAPDRHIARCRVLPMSCNAREGWKQDQNGQTSVQLQTELADPKHLVSNAIRDENGFFPSVSATSSGKKADGTATSHRNNVKESQRPVDMLALPANKLPADAGGPKISSANTTARKSSLKPASIKASSIASSGVLLSDGLTTSDFSAGDTRTGSRRTSISFESKGQGHTHTADEEEVYSGWSEDESEEGQTERRSAPSSRGERTPRSSSAVVLGPEGELARQLDDDVILDCSDALSQIGRPNPRQIHGLSLRSAYESYSSGGEPLYTTSQPSGINEEGVRCIDYIFYSCQSLRPVRILSIPLLNELEGDNPLEPVRKIDYYSKSASKVFSDLFDRENKLGGIMAKNDVSYTATKGSTQSKSKSVNLKSQLQEALKHSDGELFWGGSWVPHSTANSRRVHAWLPNDSFASTHVALCVEINLVRGNLACEWR